MAEGSRAELAECLKLIIGVVYSTYKSKLISRSSTGPLGILGHGGVKVSQTPAFGAGYECVARSLNCRVEGNGERELLRFSCKLGYSRQNAAGRDGQMACTDACAVRIVESTKSK